MNTDTPETDSHYYPDFETGDYVVLAEFCRNLERERELCNDPDHGAINAERAEARGLKKAWVELDDKRQILERKLAESEAYADKLAAGLPVGMLPADVENLREANGKLADSLYKAERELASALSDVNLYKTYIAELQAQKKF